MAQARVFSQALPMPSPESNPSLGSTPSPGTASAVTTCCRRLMSAIEVTNPHDVDAAKLALHSCASCGRHLWVRDGLPLDWDDVLSVVQDRIAEAPRQPVPPPPGPSEASKPASEPGSAGPSTDWIDLQEPLSTLKVHGS